MRTPHRLADIIINPIFNCSDGIPSSDARREAAHDRCVNFIISDRNQLLAEVENQFRGVNRVVEAARMYKHWTNQFQKGIIDSVSLVDETRKELFLALDALEADVANGS